MTSKIKCLDSPPRMTSTMPAYLKINPFSFFLKKTSVALYTFICPFHFHPSDILQSCTIKVLISPYPNRGFIQVVFSIRFSSSTCGHRFEICYRNCLYDYMFIYRAQEHVLYQKAPGRFHRTRQHKLAEI